MNKNNCKCPKPPGGETICEANQIAICRIRNGEIEALCITPPGGMVLTIENLNFHSSFTSYLMFEITNDPKWQRYSLLASDFYEAFGILQRGSYVNPLTGDRTNINLPKELTGTSFSSEGGTSGGSMSGSSGGTSTGDMRGSTGTAFG